MNLRQLWRNVLISLIFGAIVFIALSLYANLSDLLSAFKKISPFYFPLLLCFASYNYIFRFIKWDFYVRCLEISITRKQSFTIFMAGLIMSISPGKFGEVLKAFLIKSINETPISRSAPIVVAERLTDFIGLIILVMIGFSTSQSSLHIIVFSILIIISFLLVLSSPRLIYKIIDLFQRFLNHFFPQPTESITNSEDSNRWQSLKTAMHSLPTKLHIAYESISLLVKPKRLLWTTILSVISWSFEGIAFVILLHAFKFYIPLTKGMFIYFFSIIIGALTMLPGGVGLTETSLSGLLIINGLSKPIAIAATLIIRVATLWFAVAIGVFVLSLFMKKHSNVRKNDRT